MRKPHASNTVNHVCSPGRNIQFGAAKTNYLAMDPNRMTLLLSCSFAALTATTEAGLLPQNSLLKGPKLANARGPFAFSARLRLASAANHCNRLFFSLRDKETVCSCSPLYFSKDVSQIIIYWFFAVLNS